MKKLISIFILFALMLSISGCGSVGDVITQHPREYLYKAGEQINFYDNISTGNHLYSLIMVSMFVLSDTPFTIREKDGQDENGNNIYVDTEYKQLVQINYVGKASSDMDDIESRFAVEDENGDRGVINPKIKYSKKAVDKMNSFVIALKSKSSKIEVGISR